MGLHRTEASNNDSIGTRWNWSGTRRHYERVGATAFRIEEVSMFLVRDIMYCKPGQARPMVQKFLALAKLGQQMGFGQMRVMTDVSAERYWTVVSEIEVDSLEKHAEMTRKSSEMKEFQEAMKGYHDLVDHGRREIYQIEK
jgi:hypothetical protein